MSENIIISTQDHLGDYKIIKTFGLVAGTTVRTRTGVRNLWADLKSTFHNLAGGEMTAWTQASEVVRKEALDRLTQHAEALGANAVVALRFLITEIDETSTEIVAYGTAVLVQK